MLAFGAIASIDFHFRRLSAFELLTVLVLFIGGMDLLLRSLRGVCRIE